MIESAEAAQLTAVVIFWFIDNVDCNSDQAPRINFLRLGRISLAAVIVPSHSTLLRLLLRTCQFSQCLFSLPYLRVGEYKLEATPLMIQEGRRYVRLSSSRRALSAIFRIPLRIFRSLLLSTVHWIRYFDSCHSDCFAPLIVQQTLENLCNVSLAYWESFVGWSHSEPFCRTISFSHARHTANKHRK